MSTYMNVDAVSRPMTYRELFTYLWPYLMRYKRYFFTVVLSMVGLAVVGRLLPFLFGYAIDHGIVGHDRPLIVRIAGIYFALELTRGFLTYLHTYLFVKMGNKILFEIRDRLIRHVQAMPIGYFDKTPTGRIVTRITNDVLAMGELFTEGLILVFTNALSLLAILIAMLWISPKLTLISIAIVPIMVGTALSLSHRIQELLRDSKRRLAAINAFVAENLNGIRVLQLHNRTGRNAERFATLSHDYMAVQLKSVSLYALLWPAVSFFFAVALASALYFGGFYRHSGELAIGAFVAFLMNVQDFFPPLRSILEKYQQFQNSLTSAERVFTLLGEAVESETPGAKMAGPKLRGEVEFRRVGFRYGPSLPPVLRELSFRIEPGQSLAIVGRTGSGKSTIISLLQRLYEGHSGEIRIDGHDLLAFDRRSLRSRIGVVQQDNFIFRGTIRDNITLFNSAITQAQVEQAVKLSSCQPVVDRHGGLEGAVEERGSNLSVGERQLIAFARILAYNPDILILDEATANIDSYSESLIQTATRQVTRGRTSIIVAHRLSTILECDQILVLEQGELKEIGSHQQLMAKQGAYFNLQQGQQGQTPATEV